MIDVKDLPQSVQRDVEAAWPKAESMEQLAYALRSTAGYRLRMASELWLGGDWQDVQKQLRLSDAYLTAAARAEEDDEQEQA